MSLRPSVAYLQGLHPCAKYCHQKYVEQCIGLNTFAASYLNTQRLNNSCLKITSVDLSRF